MEIIFEDEQTQFVNRKAGALLRPKETVQMVELLFHRYYFQIPHYKFMEQANWIILPTSALIPLIIGYIWYSPNVFGNRLAKITDEKVEVFGGEFKLWKIALLYLFSFILSYALTLVSVHQVGVLQLFFMDPSLADTNSEFNKFIADFMDKYGTRHRSFGHGVIHGAEAAFFYGLAFLGIPTLLSGKPLKQIWIHLGFCVLCGALIAGLNCAFF